MSTILITSVNAVGRAKPGQGKNDPQQGAAKKHSSGAKGMPGLNAKADAMSINVSRCVRPHCMVLLMPRVRQSNPTLALVREVPEVTVRFGEVPNSPWTTRSSWTHPA